MSARSNITLDVKKTRPSASRSQSSMDAPTRPTKAATTAAKPPGRPKSRASKKKTGIDSGQPSPALPPAAQRPATSHVTSQTPSLSPSRTGPDSDDEVSRLTHGVKKITLVTKEMREAREAAKKTQAANQTTPSTAAKPVAKVRPSSINTEHPVARPKSSGPPSSTLPSTQTNQAQSLPATSPTLPTTPLIEVHQPTMPELDEKTADLFVPYQPEGSTPQALPQKGPLKWLPPNQTETPRVSKKGHNFTAKSSIPFADSPTKDNHVDNTNGQQAQTPVKVEKQEGDLWEIPETPDCH
ncbi:histone deacetylase domain-containing protein [Apiospora rasikravindrae]|uniref:Histone deacetylase domain-containing protein n=1 Tax=Apiospora rasikravindrae TaxID=990691 RepID=A0ABR1TWV5_9PEZI